MDVPENPISFVTAGPLRILVTGGARSGKSRHGEELFAAEASVVYVAPGQRPDPAADAEWAARVRHHRDRRPQHWRTHETADLASAITDATGDAVLIDCLGTWMTARIDHLDGWNRPSDDWWPDLERDLDAAIAAMLAHPGTVVAVTNEVGLGIVPEHASGRLFRDALGWVNQRWAAACDEVHLVVAGRVIRL